MDIVGEARPLKATESGLGGKNIKLGLTNKSRKKNSDVRVYVDAITPVAGVLQVVESRLVKTRLNDIKQPGDPNV